jgi:Mu transposase, C-terminal domain
MLSREKRTAILELHHQGLGTRAIKKVLKISRGAIKKVIASHSHAPPPIVRASKAEPHRQEILELHTLCKGNLVRVHEELLAQGAELSYPALTAFCRRQGIGVTARTPAGSYPFEPGQEIQHDTSPHLVTIGAKTRKVQTASAVLCHSRMLFLQCYPRFRRFECKSFLTEALKYFGGTPEVVMIDNTHVVVLRGTGKTMIPVPEMEAFSQRFGFLWKAHEIGDANRKAHVERSFHHFETNFLSGRSFEDFRDLNHKALQWCKRKNSSYKRHLKAKPIELYALETMRLRPLPAHIPEPYRIHHRTVSVEGYVSIDTHKYSVPPDWTGRQVQVRETQETIYIEISPSKPTVIHQRVIDPNYGKTTLAEHRIRRGQDRKRKQKGREEKILLEIAPELAPYIEQLRQKANKQTTLALRQLLRLVREYPREPLQSAVKRAHHYGLYDLDRVESLLLRFIADEYFQLDPDGDDDD